MRNLIGPLIHTDGSPLVEAKISIRAVRGSYSTDGTVIESMERSFLTDGNGDFIFTAAFGDYEVWLEIPDSGGAMQRAGIIVVEEGNTIALGELIELSRDKSADYSISADWATKNWVTNQIALGAQPYDVHIDDLNPGDGEAFQLYRVTANGLNVEPFTPTLGSFPVGTGVSRGRLVENDAGNIAALPVARTITANTVAVVGDRILVDMDAAIADVAITLPANPSVIDEPVAVIIKSDTYILPHTLSFLHGAGQTIMGLVGNIEVTRRRSFVLHYFGGNDWRFT